MITILQSDISRRLFGNDDDESWLETLVSFRREKAAEFIKHFASDPAKLGAALASLAEAVLGVVTQRAAAKTQARFGIPSYRDNNGQFDTADLGIIAMGKFGARELLPESDLDVLFLYSHWGETRGRGLLSNQEYFARLAQGIMSLLQARTSAGFLYRMDTALRPSGNAGVLVTSLDAFTHYHQVDPTGSRTDAAGWERLSLIRARPVVGPSHFLKQIAALLESIVYEPPVPHGLAAEILHLRQRMERELSKESAERIDVKLGAGGIVDIEFAVQFLQISLGKIYPELRTTSTFKAMTWLKSHGVLQTSECRLLEEAYRFYLQVEARIRDRSLTSINVLARNSMLALETALDLKLESARQLTARLDELKTQVRDLFLKILHSKHTS